MQVKEWMHRQSGVPMEALEAHMFLLRDRDATQHLMEVAGGLDSLIKGEGQILAQVRVSVGGKLGFLAQVRAVLKRSNLCSIMCHAIES